MKTITVSLIGLRVTNGNSFYINSIYPVFAWMALGMSNQVLFCPMKIIVINKTKRRVTCLRENISVPFQKGK